MQLFRLFFAFYLAVLMGVGVFAQERGTKDEAKVMVESALVHIKKVGKDQAFKDFSTDKATWTKKDLYVFVQDFSGKVLAHGTNEKLIGKNMIDMKDQNGKAFAREFSNVGASKGEGWVDYDWAHPVTKKVEGKSSFVKRFAGFDGVVVVGVYR